MISFVEDHKTHAMLQWVASVARLLGTRKLSTVGDEVECFYGMFVPRVDQQD